MSWSPLLTRSFDDSHPQTITLGHPFVDEYLAFAGARLRLNSWLAVAFDLNVFFSVVGKEPEAITTADVFAFIKAQRARRLGPKMVRLEDGEAGLSARTIKRRLASVSGLFAYLLVRGDLGVHHNPVPRGTATRRPSGRPGRWASPLIRTPRTLPRVLSPADVDRFMSALRTHRDRAMVEAMVLGGLRRCEVLGLRLPDISPGEHRLFIAEGKGGHQRSVPVSKRFFATLSDYLANERPQTDIDRVFVVLKGRRRGQPLSASGLDEIVDGARQRAEMVQLTCHQLRHTCLTRLREAGMALEAVQAQAGHRSIESTRIYLHLANTWLVEEYTRAVDAIEADLAAPGVNLLPEEL
ncbi:MAG: tyrosine-type recombinase/integrase [Chloroflexi bacterium]|nr:tyrosine-type recombinase/integrase [Chloroflexota bacterium]